MNITDDEMLDTLLDHMPLTDWEAEFVDSLDKQRARWSQWSERQLVMLRRLFHVRIVRGERPREEMA